MFLPSPFGTGAGDDPIGLVPMVKQVEQLNKEKKILRPPRLDDQSGVAIFLGDILTAPKGRSSPSPGQRPGENGPIKPVLSAQRANPSTNAWPVGPNQKNAWHLVPQGVALGWANG